MIRVERDRSYLDIRLHRPECRNALSIALLRVLRDALAAHSLQDASAVIISGDGGVFSAGADLADLKGTSADVAMDDAIADVTTAIGDVRIPVIAWVDGPCIGAGVDIMLACDIRVAAAGAWFQVPATRLGLLYNPTAVARMHGMLARDALTRLLVYGERFDTPAALAAQLVTHGASPNTETTGLAPIDRPTENDPAAVAATSELLDALDKGDYDAEQWQRRRLELLDSRQRSAAVAAAKNRQRLE